MNPAGIRNLWLVGFFLSPSCCINKSSKVFTKPTTSSRRTGGQCVLASANDDERRWRTNRKKWRPIIVITVVLLAMDIGNPCWAKDLWLDWRGREGSTESKRGKLWARWGLGIPRPTAHHHHSVLTKMKRNWRRQFVRKLNETNKLCAPLDIWWAEAGQLFVFIDFEILEIVCSTNIRGAKGRCQEFKLTPLLKNGAQNFDLKL